MTVALVLGVAFRLSAVPPELVPVDGLDAAVASLGQAADIETFGIAPSHDLAVATFPSSRDRARSVLRCARGGEAPREVALAGRALGLAVTRDGDLVYAVVRQSDRKGATQRVDLVRVDLKTLGVTLGTSLPATARGLALGSDEAALLVACRNEIRTFRLPKLTSGPLYAVPGDNVGIASIEGTTEILVAQPSQVVRADLAGPQGRDGLVVSQEFSAPAPLRGMMASTGGSGPIALAEDHRAWRIRASIGAPTPPAEVDEPRAEPSPAEVTEAPARQESVGAPGMVFGVVTGPARAEVDAIVFLGPDNVLREAARVVPDGDGRFRTSPLPAGGYRIVAAGQGGHVLICDPPFIAIRVDSNGAVEAPMLNVLRAH